MPSITAFRVSSIICLWVLLTCWRCILSCFCGRVLREQAPQPCLAVTSPGSLSGWPPATRSLLGVRSLPLSLWMAKPWDTTPLWPTGDNSWGWQGRAASEKSAGRRQWWVRPGAAGLADGRPPPPADPPALRAAAPTSLSPVATGRACRTHNTPNLRPV